MNVFELNNAIKQVQEKDLDPETLKDTLESLELPRNEKLDNVATWIEENNMKLQWLKEKKRRLSDVETSIKKQTENLQSFLIYVWFRFFVHLVILESYMPFHNQ